MKKLLFLFFLFLFSFNALAIQSAEQISTPTNGFIADYYGVLSPEQKVKLQAKLDEIEQQTTVEIGVAVIDSAEQKPIEQLAWEIGNKWKIGKTDVFNGVLILIAVDDRAWFIATAKGIEGTLPDVLVDRIAEQNFPQNFRNNDYFSGIMGALEDMQGYVQKDPAITSKYSAGSSYSNGLEELIFDTFPLPLFLFLLVTSFIASGFEKIKLPFAAGIGASNIIFLAILVLAQVGFFIFVLFFFMLFMDMIILAQRYGRSSGIGGGYWGHGHGGFHGGGFSGGFGGGGGFSGGGAGGHW